MKGDRSERRSRWGEDDEVGAANLITPEVTLRALSSIAQGRIIDLSHDIQMGHPRLDPVIPPYLFGMWAHPETMRRTMKQAYGAVNDPGIFTERVSLCMHTGTHIDALGHFTIGDDMYNGWSYHANSSNWGLDRLGIDRMPPLITRGVCIDVGGLDDGDHLDGGRVVGKADIKKALDKARLELEPGDVLMIRTGWGRFFMLDNDRYTASEPGIDEDAARWLTGQQICAIGSDNMGVEVLPNPEQHVILPVHQHALVEAGVYLIENLALDELVRQGLTSFCLIILPVKFKGASGSPIRPIAVI